MFWNSKKSLSEEGSKPPVPGKVEVYGTSWCGKTQMVRRYFDRQGIPYKYIDLEEEPGALNKLRWLTGGHASHPTVVIDGQVLVEPSIIEMDTILARYK